MTLDYRPATIPPSTQCAKPHREPAGRDDSHRSLQPTSFQVHPTRHRISGWRLSPPVIVPPSRGLCAAGNRRSASNCESTVIPTVAGRNDPDGSAVGAATASRRQNIRHEGYPVSWACSQGSVFDHLREGCHDDRRPLLTSLAATGIPVRSTKARNIVHPATPNDGHPTPPGALPPTSPDARRSGLRPSNSRTSRHRI
jgi:hypothetical protein